MKIINGIKYFDAYDISYLNNKYYFCTKGVNSNLTQKFVLTTGIYILENPKEERHLLNGEIHRIDGPAIITNNQNFWFYHGKDIEVRSQEDFERKLIIFDNN